MGVPLVVFTFVLLPPLVYGMDRVAGRPAGSLWSPDPGHLWFVEVLLLYCLGYAAWRRLRPVPPLVFELRLRHLLALAVAVAAASFVVRLRFALNSTQFAELHLSQWPQYLALFGLGLASRRRGWLDPVPDRLRRACGMVALVGAVAIGGFAGLVAVAHVPVPEFFGGWHWASAATAATEGLLAVTVSVWLLGIAQRHLNRPAGPRGAAVARSAYAAFLVQGHVLVGLALALRPVHVPAEVKASAVSVIGVAGCFGLGWLLVARTPLRRVL
ncbi:MAG: hypothetical protein AUI14_17305 [Actinobacteria bacterium 13_2_20CM_2_71_6]|nr:MAG: hypothetical protein AUI14_17305 [Actinobacteria bacterium 13_2_20CM_2_71_6]